MMLRNAFVDIWMGRSLNSLAIRDQPPTVAEVNGVILLSARTAVPALAKSWVASLALKAPVRGSVPLRIDLENAPTRVAFSVKSPRTRSASMGFLM